MIAVSCGVKIAAVHHFVLSEYAHQTDGQTELRQQYRVLHYMQPHGKNGGLDQYGAELSEQQQFGTADVEGVRGVYPP